MVFIFNYYGYKDTTKIIQNLRYLLKKYVMIDKRILSEIDQAKKMMFYTLGTKETLNEVLLTENGLTDAALLEEGAKDWIIGASMLLASILNPGKLDAQVKQLQPNKADSAIAAVNSVLQDQTKLNQD